MLTPKQKQIIEYIKKYSKKRGYSPTQKEIGKHFGLVKSTIHQHIETLKEKGYLNKLNNQARAIEVIGDENLRGLVNISLRGTIAAGQPIEAIEDRETIAVPKNKLPKSGEFYALRVIGDSMIDENINDGDIILVKQQSIAENGQKIVALIDNHEATLKKFYSERGYYRLQPANKTIEPIIIKKDRELSIQGIVIDVIKNEEELQATELLSQKETKHITALPLNKIIQRDAVEELKKMPNESCDVIIIDPPYNIGKNFGNNLDKRELGEYIRWCKSWINECIRAMKPTATMFIYGFSEILAYLSIEIPINKRWLIWHYTNKNMASCNFWQRSHEAIICAWKDKPIFNKDEIREPYTDGFLNGAAGKIRTGKSVGRLSRKGIDTIYNAHPNGALPRDVIKIPSLAGGAGMAERWFLCKTCNNVFEPRQLKKHLSHMIIKHPTQKPLELGKKLIKSSMPKKDGIVLVPFVGSGSECVAAKELGQSYVGFEINPDYIRIADNFLKNIRPNKKLL